MDYRYRKKKSPFHTVGSERIVKKESSRNELAKEFPSHTVGSEHTYYSWLKTLMKKSPSHAVGLEPKTDIGYGYESHYESPSHPVGLERVCD